MTPRAALTAAFAALGAALLAAPAAATGTADDPVRLTVSAPAVVALNAPVPIGVTVSSDPGAFDIAGAPVRLRVRLSPAECRDTFATTSGPVAIDERLALPARPSPAFTATLSGRARPSAFGPAIVCAFVEEEGSNRLYAVDIDTQLTVSRACTDATRRQATVATALAAARRGLGQARRASTRAHQRRARNRARRRVRSLTRQVKSLTAALGTAQLALTSACA